MSGSKNRIGRLSKLYFNTGTYASPTWIEVDKIGDVDIDDAASTSDSDSRESGNTKTIGGNDKFAIKFEYGKVRGIADAAYSEINTSRRTKDCIDTLALDGDVTEEGSEGLRGPFWVTTKNKKEPVNDKEVYSIEMHEGYEYDDDGDIIDCVAVVVGASGLEEVDFEA